MRAIVVTHYKLVRALLADVIRELTPGAIVNTFERAKDAILHSREMNLDIAILSVQMEDIDGLDYIPEFVERHLAVRTVVIFDRHDDRTLRLLTRLPIQGFLDAAELDVLQLRKCIQNLLLGKRYVADTVGKYLASITDPSWARLTSREALIFSLLASGDDDDILVRSLNISCGTLRKHRENIMRKLSIHHKGNFVNFALRHSFIRFTSIGILHPGFQRELGLTRVPEHNECTHTAIQL